MISPLQARLIRLQEESRRFSSHLAQTPGVPRTTAAQTTLSEAVASATLWRGASIQITRCNTLLGRFDLLDLLEIKRDAYSVHQDHTLIDQLLVGDFRIHELAKRF